MKFKTFMEGITGIETIANEFMSNVAVQVTNDAYGKHKAIFMVDTPYSNKTRDFTVIPSPYAADELLIELDPHDGSHFQADMVGFYKFMWNAAESDFAKTDAAIKKLMQPYSMDSGDG